VLRPAQQSFIKIFIMFAVCVFVDMFASKYSISKKCYICLLYVFYTISDLTEVVPETERLDSSLQKAKAQLSIKTKRHRPSRTRLRDSVSSIDGDDSTDRMVCIHT